MDIEQKLNLIQQIHREQEENERYVYNNIRMKKSNRMSERFDDFSEGYRIKSEKDGWEHDTQTYGGNSLRFRMLVVLLLFLCFFVMDKKEIVYKEIGSKEIIQYISKNMEIQELSTLFDNK